MACGFAAPFMLMCVVISLVLADPHAEQDSLGRNQQNGTHQRDASRIDQREAFALVASALLPNECPLRSSCSLEDECTTSPPRLKEVFHCYLTRKKHAHVDTIQVPGRDGTACGGTLPADIAGLTFLTRIEVTRCRSVAFSIPSELGRLRKLQRFRIVHSDIVGTIPSELGNAEQLDTLSFKNISLSGTFPWELSRLPRMASIEISDIGLHGGIDSKIGLFPSLEHLYIKTSGLTGALPASIGRLRRTLAEVCLEKNALSGSVPSELGRLSELQEIDLRSNRLKGAIPWEAFHKLEKLLLVDLSRNHLQGEVDLAVNLSRARMLRVNGNSLRGQVPTELGKLTSSILVELSDNRLFGSIPTEIGTLESTFFLGLHTNKFEGTVPAEVVGRDLGTLLLHHNNFKGQIPSSLQNLSRLDMLTLHDNALQGRLPALTFTCGFYVPTHPLLTVHGNRLSCELPDVHFVETESCDDTESWRSPICSVILGNRFSEPEPDWLPRQAREKLQGAL